MDEVAFYFTLGWEHIISWDALDHLLFLLALTAGYTVKDLKKVIILVTAFTIGHCITLLLGGFFGAIISEKWVEFLIPLTIVLTAILGIFRSQKSNTHIPDLALYLSAAGFGLIHGMGFASTARVLISSHESLLLALLGFNIGVESGQLVVVSLLLIASSVVLNVFKISQKYWVIAVCSIVLVLALKICAERIPF